MRHLHLLLTARIGAFLLALTCLAGVPDNAKAQNSRTDAVRELALLANRGCYDEIILQATQLLSQPGADVASLRYLRGYAENGICWLGAAEQDLRPLQDFTVYESWPPASKIVQEIEELRKLCPPIVHELRGAGAAKFRVYCDEDNAWTAAILKLLPEAQRIGQEMFGVKIWETPVFIFKSTERHAAFCKLKLKRSLFSWEWASGDLGLFMFCEFDPKGKKRSGDIESDYFRGTVTHEYTHALLRRLVGNAPLPPWLNEGLACVAGSRAAPKDIQENDEKMRTLFDANKLLPLSSLSEAKAFYDSVEKLASAEQQAIDKAFAPQPDGYMQAMHMVRYLLDVGRKVNLQNFITRLAQTGDLNGSFQETYRLSIPDFYKSWLTKNGVKPATP